VAIPHPAPWVQIAAVNQDQTRNTMTVFPGLFSRAALDEYDVDIGKLIIYSRKGAARIEAVTSSPRALEGGRPSLVVADETAHWLAANDGAAMMSAIRRNLGKSRDGAARVMEITNAHLVEEGSVAEATYEAWRQSDGQLEGVYYDSVEAPLILGDDGKPIALNNLPDPVVMEGLRAARGDSVWVDLTRVLAEMRDPTTSESISRRFYFNQVWSGTAESWAEVTRPWPDRAVPGPVPDGVDVMLAVDGSYNDDSTGIMVAACGDRPHLDVVGVWERPEAGEGEWTVPIEEVEGVIRTACKRWRVRELLFDPYRWARTMQALAKEGLPVVEYPQTPERMCPATARFQTAVVNGTLTHSGDERLTRHLGNAVVNDDYRGRRLRKQNKWSPRKIDLAIAAVMAHDRAASRPSMGAGWLSYLKQELGKQGEQTAVANGNSGPPGPAVAALPAASPRDYLLGPDAPEIPKPSATCQHRWFGDGHCVYCGAQRSDGQ